MKTVTSGRAAVPSTTNEAPAPRGYVGVRSKQ